ncbi:MAG: TonB-dependent receptor [Campylobacter sp.]|nr:TonB-dependent receptor [Campylobacter sp.]
MQLAFACTQTSDTPRNIDLNPIVVTATGFSETLKDETRNIYVITKDDIANFGYRTLREAIEKLPSVDMIDNGAGVNIDMRGQGIRGAGVSPTMSVKVMLNGVPMNMLDTAHGIVPFDMIAIEDVEQIEAMPGGGAVLYGSGTRGGVINIITKTKPRDFYANLSSKFGSYSYRDFAANLGGNVNDDLFLKFSGKGFGTKGYQDDFKDRGYYLSGAINYKISDTQNISLTPSLYKAKVNSPGSLTLNQVRQNRRQNSNPNGKTTLTKNTKFDISSNYEGKFGDFYTLNLMPFYQRIKIENESNIDYPSNGLFGDKKYGLNLKNKFDYTNGEFILGYDFTRNKGERESHYKVTMSPVMQMKHDTVLDLQKDSHAVYFMNKYDFTKFFDLSAGYRFERSNYDVSRISDMKTTMRGMPVARMTSYNQAKSESHQNNHAFEITPNFSYSDTGNVYLKFERGYISPSPSQLTNKDATTSAYSFNNLKSEKFNTYEIGLKDEIAKNPFNFTLFYTDTKDEIAYQSFGGHGDGWAYYNLAKTKRYGFEAYAKQFLFDSLMLSESYSYVNAKIKQGANSGKEVPFVSKHKVVIGADYEILKDFHVFSDFKYYSSQKDTYYEKIESRTIVDMGLSYTFASGFSINGGVKNLFNKKYYNYQSKIGDDYSPANERNYYIEFKYEY